MYALCPCAAMEKGDVVSPCKVFTRARSGFLVAAFAFAALLLFLAPKQAFAAIDEVEDNNSFETATPISMNQNVYGTFAESLSDDDYFKINLPQAGTVKLTIVNDKRADDGTLSWYRYNNYFEFEDWSYLSFDTTKPATYSVQMNKGWNYLRLYMGSSDKFHPYHFKLTYVVPGTTIKKVTPAKKAFTVKWTKKSGTAKYQIRYSTKKSMSKAKTVNVSKAAKSKKIKGLKSGKKYYVQMRVVKKIGGQTYYSSWSSKKSVRVK